MDSDVKFPHKNPKDAANIFSKLVFGWMIKVFHKGVTKGFNLHDLYGICSKDKSERLGEAIEKNWNKRVEKAKLKNEEISMFKVISDTFFWSYMVYGILLFLQIMCLRTFQGLILGYLVSLFSPENQNEDDRELKMYMSGLVLILNAIVVVFIQHHCNFGQSEVGMRIRIATSSLVYRKMLRLSKKSLGQTAAGQVVNMLSNDVSRFDFVAIALHYIWIAPFQIALVTYLLYEKVGVACFAGITAIFCLTLPLQAFLGSRQQIVRGKIAVRTDKRVRIMTEIISGIQVIKMYAWEKPFEKLVKFLRKNEIDSLTTSAYLRGVFMSIMVFLDRSALFLTLITYALAGTGGEINAELVFSCQQFFSMLLLSLGIFLPLAMSIGAECLITIRRLQDFMTMEERINSGVQISTNQKITIDGVKANWAPDNEKLTLDNVSFEIPAGKLCAIIGPVGAGKSSLLQLLLGELPIQEGKVAVCGEISYSSQEPWLFVSTVKDNILFGQKFNEAHYRKVTKVCALLQDFKQFPQRDQTLVGERGVSLSGGQRARINLARAVYKEADIYLMDDPLSAVDTHVGKHLFEECIMKHLAGKTRILVTHQLQYLKKADIIIVLNDGKIEAKGTFAELANSKLDFTKMLVAADETAEEGDKPEERKISVASIDSIKSIKEDIVAVKNDEEVIVLGKSATKEYLKAAGNNCVLFCTGLLILLTQIACSACDYWVSYWANEEEIRNALDDTRSNPTTIHRVMDLIIDPKHPDGYNEKQNLTEFYYKVDSNYIPGETRESAWDLITAEPIDQNWAIYIYSFIIAFIIVFTFIRSFTFFKITLIAAKNLHHMMFHSLLKAPMRFFDVNPSGRVLNRFSKDMGAVDEVLPRVAMEAIQIMLVLIGILVMIIISNYYMAIAIAVFGVLFYFMRKWYLETVKNIKHVEGIMKSPVFSHLTSSLNGITTIRASHAEIELISQFDSHQDSHTSAWFINIACLSAFGLWMDFCCLTFTAIVAFSFIIMDTNFDSVDGSTVGLAISQALSLTGLLQHGMRQTAEVVNQMTSVERILHYTVLEEEGPFETPSDKKLPKNWPKTGKIKFDHMYLKYTKHDKPVLKDLNIGVESGMKVGIVGRTGAGKSSLISALFRLTLLEGAIVVDEIDSQAIGLNDLRKNISIIPQEPVLFSATLRYNLDPFDEFDDTALWNSLEEVELKESIPTLDFMVEEGGANFSLGQRQLVCLARAILRNNKVLVLDEATANVDPKTDALIQTTIRRKFKHCTVLTIAHRLNTIMDSDMVLVMDAGQMVEYDHPHKLLQKPQGHFTLMVEQTGPVMTKTLRQVAETAFRQDVKDNIDDVIDKKIGGAIKEAINERMEDRLTDYIIDKIEEEIKERY